MLAHMKTHHTNDERHKTIILYLTHGQKQYAIPEDVADKYIVQTENKSKIRKNSISSQIVFADLEKQLTKAGALLKGLRTREGLSQVNFAKKINVTQANLSNMENGRRPIGKIIAKRIEKIFKVDYRYFIE